MSHPRVDLFTPIHKAIRSMIYELGKDLQTTDFTDEAATEAIVSRLNHDLSSASSACILCLLHEHAGNEDQRVFPEVRAFEPEMVDTLMQEHMQIVRKIAGVWKIANELKALKNREQRIEMGEKLNRNADELFSFYLTHLNREEETILPVTLKHFTDEQLAAMRANVEKNTPPERYAEWLRWMFPSLNINELTGMFVGLKKGAPAAVFESMSSIAEKALGEVRWNAVKARAGL